MKGMIMKASEVIQQMANMIKSEGKDVEVLVDIWTHEDIRNHGHDIGIHPANFTLVKNVMINLENNVVGEFGISRENITNAFEDVMGD
jgi:hypothetical protein